MIKTIDEAIKVLESYIPIPEKKFPGEFGLARMKKFCEMLGNPQLSYPTVHVGGTSGKGSSATILSSMLGQKYRVGLTTSPHILRVNERIGLRYQVSGIRYQVDISDQEFVEVLNEILSIIHKMVKTEWGSPSYFEILVAMAFVYFAKKKVDIAVIEVGMGGRYDGTNVVAPVVAILTNVGRDHVEILGETVEEIARDKVGIIKTGVSVVSGVTQESVRRIVEDRCEEVGASLSLLERDFSFHMKHISEHGSRFDFGSVKDLFMTLIGEHQVQNASLAIRAVEILSKKGFPLTDTQLRNGLKHTFIPGRFEIVSQNPLIILDGAHNEDKIRALLATLHQVFPYYHTKAIVAIKKDKQAGSMLAELVAGVDELYLTQYSTQTDIGTTQSYDTAELKQLVHKIDARYPVHIFLSSADACIAAKKSMRDKDILLVTGSFYLLQRFDFVKNYSR